jgi:hypothetical protein
MIRTLLTLTTALLVTAGPLAAKGGALPKPGLGDGWLPALRQAKGLDTFLPAKGGPTCNEDDPDPIDCNSVVNNTLRATDCLFDDDTVFDLYVFEGREGDEIEIDLTSDEFDTVAFLLDPLGDLFDFNNDGGTGTNSFLAATLDSDGTWGIVVNNLAELQGDPGLYTLRLTCVSPDCATTSTAMCLNRGRFRVEVEWTDFQGMAGPGRRVALPVPADDSGIFYFFSPNNWEMLIKVLDGCDINNRYWVFGAATTTVEYAVRVTDTQTDQVRTFRNPLGTASRAITSTDAFDTCP